MSARKSARDRVHKHPRHVGSSGCRSGCARSGSSQRAARQPRPTISARAAHPATSHHRLAASATRADVKGKGPLPFCGPFCWVHCSWGDFLAHFASPTEVDSAQRSDAPLLARGRRCIRAVVEDSPACARLLEIDMPCLAQRTLWTLRLCLAPEPRARAGPGSREGKLLTAIAHMLVHKKVSTAKALLG